MKAWKTARVGMLLGPVLAAGWAWAGVEGSKHDFSHEAWSKDDQCGACHTPHRDKAPKAAPLWDPGADLAKRFGTSVRSGAIAGGGTRMCLRCHDGTIARDTISGVKRERFVNIHNPGVFQVGHQRSDHPVGVAYPQVSKHFRPMTAVLASGTVVLPGGRVECMSCHDPHDTSGAKHMLVMENTRSALCLTCHKK